MAKTKPKAKETQKKKSLVRQQDVFGEKQTQISPEETMIHWGEAVESLLSEQFSSIEEAEEAVISRVLERIHPEGEEHSGMREFLSDLFETDATLREELRSILHIK